MLQRTNILNIATLYRSGDPFFTGAVLHISEAEHFEECRDIDFFQFNITNDTFLLKYTLSKEDRVYGLGESLGGCNKRGRRYVLYSTDDPLHTPEKESLYGSHPFIIVDGRQTFGLLIDYPSKIEFDIGFSDIDVMEIFINSCNLDIYIFNSNDKRKIIKEYLSLTGAPYVPPKWAFGYHQSRWSYPDEKSIKEVALNFRHRRIPCDAIYMDIDYMKDYKCFTVDDNKFPDFKGFVRQLKDDGFNIVPIIDPGVKIEEGYSVYEEGRAGEFFCKDGNGRDFVCAVWPGLTHFPDFLNRDVRTWWAGCYKEFLNAGIEGIWNDMNEPAIFYTLLSLNEISKDSQQLTPESGIEIMSFKSKVKHLSKQRAYYRSFFHSTDNGDVVMHDDIHNLFGFYMAMSAVKGFEEFLPGRRYFLLSRSSYTGLHRFATIWTGDNMSWWEHMPLHISMVISLNLAGYFHTGADIGGFGCNASSELVVRWTQLGVFTPFFRNHTALGTRNQEPWAFDSMSEEIIADAIRLRYALLPYIYSEFMRSVRELEPFVSHLMLFFDNERTKEIEDQFMFGNSIMVAPVCTANVTGRFVHLPESKWLFWPVCRYDEREMKVFDRGDYYINAPINRIPIFIKENSLIVMSSPMNYVGEKELEELIVTGLVTDRAVFDYYDDDGVTDAYKEDKHSVIKIKVERKGDDFDIACDMKFHSDVSIVVKRVKFEIYDETGGIYCKEFCLQ